MTLEAASQTRRETLHEAIHDERVAIRSACVTGASGCIGQALLRRLAGTCHVKALFRTESDESRAWRARGCEIVTGDLADPASLARLVKDAEFIFHCAATMGKTDAVRSYEVNVLGTRRLLQAAVAAGCRLFVHISSISVYAATEAMGGVLTEDIELAHLEALNPYSRTKLLSEREVRCTCAGSGLHYLILRPTNVYGPLSRPWFLAPARIVSHLPVLGGDVEIDLVHVDDLAKAAVQAAQCPLAWDETFNLGHESRPLREFLAEMAHLLGCRPAMLPRTVDRFLRHAVAALHRAATGTEMSLSLVRSRRYPASKAKALFGYRPEIHLEEGLRQTVHWYFQQAQEARASAPLRLLDRPRRFEALAHRTVRTQADLIATVKEAAGSGTSVRAAGAMGSRNGSFHTPGIALDLTAYNRVVSIDGPLVTVQAGMRLADLYGLLNRHGLALASVGEWTGATVAGAISTGTHGGSIHLGSMASQVESLRVVLADGSVRVVGRDDPRLLAILGISFGVFGILSEVTLRCVPRFRLRLEKTLQPFGSFLKAFVGLNVAHRYWSAIWIPSARQVMTWVADPTPQPPTRGRWDRRYGLANLSACWLCNRTRSDFFFRRRDFPDVVGDWNEILAPIGESAFAYRVRNHFRLPIEVEVAVPVQEAQETLLELDALFQRQKHFPAAPVGLRCGGAEELRLSPCYRRDALWIDLFIGDDPPLLAEVPRILARHRSRFHWGKNMLLPPEYTMAQYESWGDLVRLKSELDPHGIFSNAFSRRFGL
jgi:L-gulonolactone oxidase